MTSNEVSAFSDAGRATRVMITRPAQQSVALLKRFEASGITAVSMPMLQTEALHFPPEKDSSIALDAESSFLAPQSTTILQRLRGQHSSAEKLPPFSKALFVSANAVKYTAEALNYFGDASRCQLNAIPCLGMGRASAAAIREQGWLLDSAAAGSLPDAYTSETLLSSPWVEGLIGESLLICRGRGGRSLLVDSLSEKGISVSTLEAYRRIQPYYGAESKQVLLKWLFDPDVHFERLVLLGSQEAAENFLSLVIEAQVEAQVEGQSEMQSNTLADAERKTVIGKSGRHSSEDQPAGALRRCSFVVPSERVATSLLKQLSQHPKLEMMLFGQHAPYDCILVAANAGDQAMLEAALSRIEHVPTQ